MNVVRMNAVTDELNIWMKLTVLMVGATSTGRADNRKLGSVSSVCILEYSANYQSLRLTFGERRDCYRKNDTIVADRLWMMARIDKRRDLELKIAVQKRKRGGINNL